VAPSTKELKILLLRAGNRCAFPGCDDVLVDLGPDPENPTITGQIVHIVAETLDGPRGYDPLPQEKRDDHSNLMLLCPKHHKIIDDKPQYYTVERLHQFKEDHESMLSATAIDHGLRGMGGPSQSAKQFEETVHSTLLPVLAMPLYVYGIDSGFHDGEETRINQELSKGPRSDELCPFVIRGDTLYAFNDLRKTDGPFSQIADPRKAKRWESHCWWDDPDRQRWYVDLLNRSLNKLTGRKGLRLDKVHRRYYFQADEKGKELEIAYRPLNQKALTSRKVVWQPISKSTGLPRPRWNHLAVALRFMRVDQYHWCLSVRPEMRLTKDGIESIESELVGRNVTRIKARMFNYDLLEEINFWRDYLSNGRPRIVLHFGVGQNLVLSTTMMSSAVEWPGIPEEYAKQFRNVEYEEDLFTSAEKAAVFEESDDADEDMDEDVVAEEDLDSGEAPNV